MASSSSQSALSTPTSSSSTSMTTTSTTTPERVFTDTRILKVSIIGTDEFIKEQTDPVYRFFWAEKLFNQADEFKIGGLDHLNYQKLLVEAHIYLQSAADGMFPPALALLAQHYLDGKGVKKCEKTAFYYTNLAGYGSCPLADYLHGYFHEKGMLSPTGKPDIAKAIQTYDCSYLPAYRRKYALELIAKHLDLKLEQPDYNERMLGYLHSLPAKVKEEPENSTYKLHYALVLCLGLGNTEANTSEALLPLIQLRKEGNLDGNYFLMHLSQKKSRVPAEKILSELGEAGHVLALKELADEDSSKGGKWIKLSAKHNDIGSLFCVAVDELEEEFEVGLTTLKKAAEANWADAQYTYFRCILKGGTETEKKSAITWLEKAATNGCSEAQYKLGLSYGKGENGLTKNFKLAEYWFKSGAQQGHVECQYELGNLHVAKMASESKEADHPKSDMEEALKWYRRASAQGHVKATENMLTLYGAIKHAGQMLGVKQTEAKLDNLLNFLRTKPGKASVKTEPKRELTQKEMRLARREAKLQAEKEAKEALEREKAAEEKKAEELKKSLEEAKKILDEKIKAEEEQKAKAAEERRLKNKAREEERKKRRAEKAKEEESKQEESKQEESKQEESKQEESKQELKQESKREAGQTQTAGLLPPSLSSTPVKPSGPVQSYVALAYPPKPRSTVPLPTDSKKDFMQYSQEIENLYAEFGSLLRKGLIDENGDEDKKLIREINKLYNLFPGLYNKISTPKAIKNLTEKLKKFKAMEGKAATTVAKHQPKKESKEEAKVESNQVKEELKEKTKEKAREESKETGRKERNVETKEESKEEKKEELDTTRVVEVSTEADSFNRFPEIKLFLKNFDDLYQTLSSKINGTKTPSFEDLILVRDSLGYLLTEFIKLILEHTHKNLLVDETVVWKLRNYLFHDAALSTPENLETDLSPEKLASMQVDNKRLWGLTTKLMSHVKMRIGISDKIPEEQLKKETTLQLALMEFEGLSTPLLDTVREVKSFDERECDTRSKQLEKEKMIYENAKKKIATETPSDKNAKLMFTYAQRFNEARLGTAVAKIHQELGIPLCEYSRRVRTRGNDRRHRLHRLFTLKVGDTKVSITTSKPKPKKSIRTRKVSHPHRFFTFEGSKSTLSSSIGRRTTKLTGKW